MRLFLVRHGRTSWNNTMRAQGHTDIPLDEKGLEQAEAVAEALQKVQITRILSSDLSRAVQTVTPLAKRLGLSVEQTQLLRERKFGDWEGLKFDEIAAHFMAQSIVQKVEAIDVRAPGGGESYSDLWNRLDALVADIFDSHQNILISSHGGTLGVLLARLVDGNVSTHHSFRFANASISELTLRQDSHFLLLRYNETSHLAAYEKARQGEANATPQ